MVIIVDNTKSKKIFKSARELPAVIIPLSEYEDMRENLDIFFSENLAKNIERSRKEIKERKTISLKEVKNKLAIK